MKNWTLSLNVALCACVLVGCATADVRRDLAPATAERALGATPPERLSETGLYRDIANKELEVDVLAYEPTYPEWSNGTEKRHFVRLPANARIDSADVDHWSFPTGVCFWTELIVDGKRVETRMIERMGPDDRDYRFASYMWNDDETDAELTVLGAKNVRGTDHDIPSVGACWGCHTKEKERVLGFSAIQLSHDGAGLTTERLAASGRLTTSVPAIFKMPGSDVAATALGYLHANCGYCHGERGPKGLRLRMSVGSRDVESTDAYRSAVGVRASVGSEGAALRIARGTPDASVVHSHMTGQGHCSALAKLDLKQVDPNGVRAVDAWIASLAGD